jgi:hypothetical protein
MNDRTFNHIRNLIKSYIIEDGGGMGVPPTTHVSPETLGGPLDQPPIDLRKKRFRNLPNHYKAFFRRGNNVQQKRKS